MTQTATQPAQQTTEYLARFKERFGSAGAHGPAAWLYPAREAGLARFVELGFPTLRQEDWRFTNLAPLASLPFKPIFEPDRSAGAKEILDQLPFAGLSCHRLVFLNGHFAPELSRRLPNPQPFHLGSLAAALADGASVYLDAVWQP